jgi:PhzF family phenazine biosynthesis protein
MNISMNNGFHCIDRRAFLAFCAVMPAALANAGQPNPRSGAKARSVSIVHTVVFATTQGGGNPCPVVLSSGLTDADMQAIANHFGQDTAFLLEPTQTGVDLRIRYFVPEHEMGISGHATVAAVTVALLTGIARSGTIKVQTITGVFAVRSQKTGSGYLITLEQNPPEFGVMADPNETARALGIATADLALQIGPIQSVSASRPKLIVPLKSISVLDGLKPDFEALWSLCELKQVSGLYPFALPESRDESRPNARQFPTRGGIPEDPATGVAAAALSAYLTRYSLRYADGTHQFEISQGVAMGAPSQITAIAECANHTITRIAVQGAAKIISRESLDLNLLTTNKTKG